MKRYITVVFMLHFGAHVLLGAASVYFEDPALKAVVEDELQIDNPTASDMLSLIYLEPTGSVISDLTGLEAARNLVELYLYDHEVSDLTPLAGLTRLEYLDVGYNRVADIGPLGNLTALTHLWLDENWIVDIDALAGLSNLQRLYLTYNFIEDVSPLASLQDLAELTLNANFVSDIQPLSQLMSLEYLNLTDNELDIAAYEIWLDQIRANNSNPPMELLFDEPLTPYSRVIGKMNFTSDVAYRNRVVTNNTPEVELVTHLKDEGVMRLRNQSGLQARAKIRMGLAKVPEAWIRIEYRFKNIKPSVRLMTYVSNSPDFDDPMGPNSIEVAEIIPPGADRPGSVTSLEFGIGEVAKNVGRLNESGELWVDVILMETPQTQLSLLLSTVESQANSEEAEATVSFIGIEERCTGICLDLNGDDYNDSLDIMHIATGCGLSANPKEAAIDGDSSIEGAACIDRGFGGDWIIDALDITTRDWLGTRCPNAECHNLCNDFPLRMDENPVAALMKASLVSGISSGAASDIANVRGPLLLLGKRVEETYHATVNLTTYSLSFDDVCYSVDTDGTVLEAATLPSLPHRCNTRLAQDPNGPVALLNAKLGVMTLNNEVLIHPGRGAFNGRSVHVGLQDPDGKPWGRPILDVAFDDDFAYVVPVVVDAASGSPHTAAARLRMLGAGSFEVDQLYEDAELLEGTLQNPNLDGLREIELDEDGNLYVLNTHAQNRSSLLWKYSPNGVVLKRSYLSHPNPEIVHATHLCYCEGRLYVLSNENNPSRPNELRLFGLSKDDYSILQTITIRNMQHATCVTPGPSGTLYLTGFGMKEKPTGGEANQFVPNARFAEIQPGQGDRIVEARELAGNDDLGLPMALVWIDTAVRE